MNRRRPSPSSRRKRLRPRRNGYGFTLLELMVCLSIVAILAALVLAALGEAHQTGLAAKSTSNLRQLAMANLSYAADNGCYAPADDRWNQRRWHGARTAAGQPFDPTQGFLADYLGRSSQVTPCPLFTEMLAGSASFEDGTGGYGYNASYIGGTPSWAWNADGTRKSATPAQVGRPETTMMFATTAYARADGVQEYPYAEPPFWDFGYGPSGYRPSPSVHFRFRGQALVAWCDGHVTMETEEDRPDGANPHGGDAAKQNLGWFGEDANNGYWNPNW